MNGFFFQEENLPVGMMNFQRLGKSDKWSISVLPAYRIGHQLVQAALDHIRKCDLFLM